MDLFRILFIGSLFLIELVVTAPTLGVSITQRQRHFCGLQITDWRHTPQIQESAIQFTKVERISLQHLEYQPCASDCLQRSRSTFISIYFSINQSISFSRFNPLSGDSSPWSTPWLWYNGSTQLQFGDFLSLTYQESDMKSNTSFTIQLRNPSLIHPIHSCNTSSATLLSLFDSLQKQEDNYFPFLIPLSQGLSESMHLGLKQSDSLIGSVLPILFQIPTKVGDQTDGAHTQSCQLHLKFLAPPQQHTLWPPTRLHFQPFLPTVPSNSFHDPSSNSTIKKFKILQRRVTDLKLASSLIASSNQKVRGMNENGDERISLLEVQVLHTFFSAALKMFLGPLIDAIVGINSKGITTNLNSKVTSVCDANTPNQVLELVKEPFEHHVINLMADAVCLRLTKLLTNSLSFSMGQVVADQVVENVVPFLHDKLTPTLTDVFKDDLTKNLPMVMERSVSLLLANSLARSLTHSLVNSLTITLSIQAPHRHQYCILCLSLHYHPACEYCTLNPKHLYYYQYYATYYSDYYTNYYIPYYMTALYQVDQLIYATNTTNTSNTDPTSSSSSSRASPSPTQRKGSTKGKKR